MASIVTAPVLEAALKAHLDEWLPSQMARVEREHDLQPRSLTLPRTFEVISDFEPKVHETPPALFVVSGGTAGSERSPKGTRKVWRFEIATVQAGRDEAEARRLAAYTLAAVNLALDWHQNIGGLTDSVRWGVEDHDFAGAGRQARAIYAAEVLLGVPQAVVRRPPEEPPAPPPEPYEPPPGAERFETAEINVTPLEETQ